ncbi:hypothetical protein E4U28_008465 [Claviceps purpurea]|nr:hypothetical protein E4U28_008465 [Claviceps purpurea]
MYKSNNFPTLSFKLSSVSHWGEWYDTLQTVCDSRLVWHKVDPEIPSTKENDFFVTPVMMTPEECFEVFCAQTKDKVADEYPNRKTALDYYYNEFEAKRDIVMVKQSRLHAVRGWIATTVDPNVHRIAIREIRKKLGRRPADDDADETDDVSVREIVVYLRNRLSDARQQGVRESTPLWALNPIKGRCRKELLPIRRIQIVLAGRGSKTHYWKPEACRASDRLSLTTVIVSKFEERDVVGHVILGRRYSGGSSGPIRVKTDTDCVDKALNAFDALYLANILGHGFVVQDVPLGTYASRMALF